MTAVLAMCVATTFGVGVFLLLSRELKGIAMGVFLLGHAANLSILAMSRSPIIHHPDGTRSLKAAPVLPDHTPLTQPLTQLADPLPQALILTAIVIGFAVMGFLLCLIVVTGRSTGTLETDELAALNTLATSDAL